VADIVVGRWVDASLLSLTKELVKSIEGSLLSHFILGVQVLGLANSVINGTIGGALLRCTWAMIGAWV
jgi:hypothetical protein